MSRHAGFSDSGLIYESNNHVLFLTGVLSIKDLHSNKLVSSCIQKHSTSRTIDL